MNTAAHDEVTVLYCDPARRATKQFQRAADHSIAVDGYDAGWQFSVERRTVNGIESLSALLTDLEPRQRAFVIRGEPRSGLSSAGVRRQKVNFRTPEQGRRWMLIDIDKLQLPDGVRLHGNLAGVLEHIITRLPEEFHEVTYHFQLSSSAGMASPDKVSVHLWFWLTKPWTDQRLKAWAKGVNNRSGFKLVDGALFNDVQAHYTAAPIFGPGVENPLPQRSGLVRKRLDELDLVHTAISLPNSTPHSGTSTSPGHGFEEWLRRIGDHPGGEGFHEPVIRAIAARVAQDGTDNLDIDGLVDTIQGRVLAADRSAHDDAYVENVASREEIVRAIAGAIAKFGSRPASRRPSRFHPELSPPVEEAELGPEEARNRLDELLSSALEPAEA